MQQSNQRKRVVRGNKSTVGLAPQAATAHGRPDARMQAQQQLGTKRKRSKRTRNFLIGTFMAVVVGVMLFNSSLFAGGLGSLFAGIGTPSALKGKLTTFLVAGIGDDESERSSTNLTDILMLVQVNKQDKEINILQIPRDTYVGNVTPTGKINAIYNRDSSWDYNGMEGLSKYLNEMTALPIDHFVTMKMNGFVDIVEAIGGVEMDVPADMSYKGVSVSAGKQVLGGKEALVVVRTRNIYSSGDLGRVGTQQLFMKAFLETCKNAGLGKISAAMPAVFGALNTDLSAAQALASYKELKDFDLSSIQIETLPGESSMVGGQSVYLVHSEETAALLNEKFRPFSDDMDDSDLSIAGSN